MNMQMSELMSLPHNFPFILCTEMKEKKKKEKKKNHISAMRMLDLPQFLSE